MWVWNKFSGDNVQEVSLQGFKIGRTQSPQSFLMIFLAGFARQIVAEFVLKTYSRTIIYSHFPKK